ncbi:MAG: hypothetical protein GVY28_14400 [Alphaproteobacteria bacterium]|nr:hypothetical protein [Alphaproteobacteria bacterium]
MLVSPIVAGASADFSRQQLLQRIERLETEAARIEALEARVQELQARDRASWLDRRRRGGVERLVADVLADAGRRAALRDAPIHAGHNGKGLFIASPHGRLVMTFGGPLQVRYIANWRDPSPATDGHGAGFQLRRTKFDVKGHVLNPRWHDALQLAASRLSHHVVTDQIVIGYGLVDDLRLWAGEDKGPFLRKELVSSKRQLAVERSLVNEASTLDKVQMLTAGGNGPMHRHRAKLTAELVGVFDPLHANVPGVSDGLGLLAEPGDADGQAALRVQYQLLY